MMQKKHHGFGQCWNLLGPIPVQIGVRRTSVLQPITSQHSAHDRYVMHNEVAASLRHVLRYGKLPRRAHLLYLFYFTAYERTAENINVKN